MKIEWLLPTHESRTTNDEIVNHNAKYHCFVDENYERYSDTLNRVSSLCGKHTQVVGYYDEMESGQILQFPSVACKVCKERWKKKFNIN